MAQEVTIDELESAIDNGAFVLDVREADEFQAGHVPNARHIALNTVPDQLALIPADSRIWVICQAGGRSMKAANFLEAQGYDVVSVAGGTGQWIAAGKKVSFEESV
ncbi:rhodanese-like domain-containing protein [Aquiluna borgnonia]|jgi:rhodanese-related sulfurtransferase|uniref:Rhodanese-like domain-containing protein n=1 Tax=Aquiluna borgnonia TaxID=2499157 RepID=A0A7D4PQX9_9MICO|nr:rhodanese-like domain-containing protein [Aquiluna borgnonia]QKJ25566.1 rhodanese-like domain-containing protein [Aquiluna borgnonia]